MQEFGNSGSILPLAAFFTNDRSAPALSFGRSATLRVSDAKPEVGLAWHLAPSPARF